VGRPGLSGVPAWSCGPADLAGDGRELADLDGFELVEDVVLYGFRMSGGGLGHFLPACLGQGGADEAGVAGAGVG
jgi:hypothetical protein